jgi:hypothetical protein
MPAQRDRQANGRGAGRGGGARLRLRDALALTGSLLALRFLHAILPTASRHGAQVPRRRPCDALEVALQHVALVSVLQAECVRKH